MHEQSASEESRIPGRSAQTRSAGDSNAGSESGDSCDGGSPCNSRTLLLTAPAPVSDGSPCNSRTLLLNSPAPVRKTKITPPASTSSLGICNEASTFSSIPYVRCATNVQISTVQIEPTAEQLNAGRECNREQHDACLDIPEPSTESASTIRSNLSFSDYIPIIRNNPAEHIIAREHNSSVFS